MSSPVVARRYAKALLELGKESGDLDALVRESASVAALYAESADLRGLFVSPLVSDADKMAIVRELCAKSGFGKTTTNVWLMLVERRRADAMPEIAAALRTFADAERGTVRADVRTAGPLSEAYRARLSAALEKRVGRAVSLHVTTDESLLAGLVVRVGDTVMDGSLTARLSGASESLRAL